MIAARGLHTAVRAHGTPAGASPVADQRQVRMPRGADLQALRFLRRISKVRLGMRPKRRLNVQDGKLGRLGAACRCWKRRPIAEGGADADET